jgi:hypothetical protein
MGKYATAALEIRDPPHRQRYHHPYLQATMDS